MRQDDRGDGGTAHDLLGGRQDGLRALTGIRLTDSLPAAIGLPAGRSQVAPSRQRVTRRRRRRDLIGGLA